MKKDNNLRFNIPIAKTAFTEAELDAVLKPLESGWVVQGPYVQEFEQKWSAFTGAKHSIATTSCTTALELSLVALGIKPDDEIIVPAFTWIATANVVEHLQAKVVFCDIDLNTFNIDVNKIEELLTEKTRAIIPVHLFGLSADMAPVIEIARKHDLLIIEDAACGFGAFYQGKHVGNFGDTGCFSFHPRKSITTGEGGMITTNDDKLAVKLRSLRDHGAMTSDLQRHHGSKPYLLPEFPYAGYNYRLTDIQASIGCAQMNRADEILEARISLAEKYRTFLDTIPWLQCPYHHVEYQHGFQAYVCLFNPEKITTANIETTHKKRNQFMEYLQGKGISTRPGTHTVHLLEYYRKKYSINPNDFFKALVADHCSIAFPLFPTLTGEELNYIFKAISGFSI
ncbi:MAG: DegT/DnrJ/EryC1/StrS family aminotransferase [Bacteroidetes bacterium]|nr:DegT/DnrJ/EryC1/StrS family aminotransferase [Bacteroidota bacterium]